MKKDELDNELLSTVSQHPGISIAAIIRPFLRIRCESSLRQRIRALELEGLIRLEKTRKEVLVYPVA
jgi:hypothetical protein